MAIPLLKNPVFKKKQGFHQKPGVFIKNPGFGFIEKTEFFLKAPGFS